MALAVGNIHDGGLFGDFVAAGDHTAEEQIFFGGEPQDDARLLVFGRNRRAGKVRQIFGNVKFLLARSALDRKSTRLNSSHRCISYAVFCLKKKKSMNYKTEYI